MSRFVVPASAGRPTPAENCGRSPAEAGTTNLAPYPRSLRRTGGFYILPAEAPVCFERIDLPVLLRLQQTAAEIGTQFALNGVKARHAAITCRRGGHLSRPSAYRLSVTKKGIVLEAARTGDVTQDGLRAGIATLRQLFREFGRRLPCLEIRDHADFPRRGVMLDVSRGRVPKIETLLQLADHLADLKINEFQLYTEHTFAYSKWEPVWRDWGAITGDDILKLDARCRELGIDLVPNQNSFGHLRHWLEHPPLRHLAEGQGPWKLPWGQVVKWPFTLAPRHLGSLTFLRGLYDELLPNFSSRFFNVGCDETWDLGQGQSAAICQRVGKGKVYLDFVKKIHREVTRRGKTMMFWGDIILQYPELIRQLPRKNLIALNWGYEANHPFEKEAPLFAQAGLPFYVCPGTSTWQTFIGRHDKARANLEKAARIGLRNGAIGFLNTDWGDGGHPQPLAVSLIPYAMGAGLSWCAKTFRDECVVPMLNRDIFGDRSGSIGRAAQALGLAHRLLRHPTFNSTPIGAALAAPPPSLGEIWCKDGLNYYRAISPQNVQATLTEIQRQRLVINKASSQTQPGRLFQRELDLAARLAAESCRYMLWQQALALSIKPHANRLARRAIPELKALQNEFRAYWPLRNKATPAKCYAFLQWRIDEYRKRL